MTSIASSTSMPPHVLRYLQGPPPENEQFAFLIGDWQVHATRCSADGAIVTHYEASWRASYLDDGRMLMDDFKVLSPDGKPLSSFVTLRTYSIESGRWEMVGLAALQPAARLEWHGTWANGEMRIVAAGMDPSGREVQTRIRFFDITKARFHWTSESSVDGGASWARTAALVADRVKVEDSE